MNNIKKIMAIGIVFIIAFSCKYDDFRDDYTHSTVYFTNQILKRSFVEDEINTIKIGVVLGGKRINALDEWVKFTIKDTIGISSTPYTLMPESYYTLSSPNEMIINSGTFMGEVTMTIDPSFFQDVDAHTDHYAIPFKILDTSANSIHSSKDSLLLLIVFESRIFGNYYHNGRIIRKNGQTGAVVDTIIYHQKEPVTNNVNNWTLLTRGSKLVYTRGLGHFAPSNLTGFFIQIEDDNTLKLYEDHALANIGYDWKFEQTGSDDRYDPVIRQMYIQYKFTDLISGYECYATDTLIFRNRILDGVNQWDL